MLFFAVALFASASGGSFKIMSYNIRHGATSDKGFDLSRCAGVIAAENPRFAALQEVDMFTRRVGGTNTCEAIAGILRENGMCATNWNFSKAMDFNGGGYGVALLSREKPLRVDSVKLGGAEPRVLLMCEFEDCWIGVTHLPLRFVPRGVMNAAPHKPSLPLNDPDGALTAANIALAEKKAKLAREFNQAAYDCMADIIKIETLARAAAKPVFLTGDWNQQPQSRLLANFKNFMTVLTPENVWTYHGTVSRLTDVLQGKCIDYIAVDSAHRNAYDVLSARVVEERIVSDHAPIVAEVRPKERSAK